MTAKVLFFGRLREIVGIGEDTFVFEDGTRVRGIFEFYAGRWPRLGELRGAVVAARNCEFVDWETAVGAGDEVAFLPPVSGG